MESRINQRCVPLALAAALAFGSLSAQAADGYGAIAFSPATGGHGYAFGFASRADAERTAVNECEQYSGAGDCRTVVLMDADCAALAVGADSWGSAAAANLATAKAAAIQNCESAGSGKACRILRWLCHQH